MLAVCLHYTALRQSCVCMVLYFVVSAAFGILLASWGAIVCWRKRLSAPGALAVRPGTRVLLVIAHPDDECMFFVPTLLHLRFCAAETHVLCLSTGARAQRGVAATA